MWNLQQQKKIFNVQKEEVSASTNEAVNDLKIITLGKISGRGGIVLGDLLACSGCRQLHGAQPLLGLVAQQLQLRGTQVPEGGKLKLVTSSK